MNSKHKAISLCIKSAKKTTGDVCIVASISSKFNSKHFEILECKHYDDVQVGLDYTAVGYSIYQCVKYNLTANPLASMKGKVSAVRAGIKNKSLNISINTQPSLTQVRKCINITLKCLTPRKLYSLYEKNMKSVGQKPNRQVFNACANDIARAISTDVKFAVIGKLSLSRSKDGKAIPEQKTVDDFVKKLKSPDQGSLLSPAGSIPPSLSESEEKFPVNKCSDVDAVFLSSYIESTSKVPHKVVDGGILVYSSVWESEKKKLADKKKVVLFVSKKLVHPSVKQYLPEVLAYRAAVSGNADATLVKKLLKNKLSEKDIVDSIVKSLK
jgi:hypothetical protein